MCLSIIFDTFSRICVLLVEHFQKGIHVGPNHLLRESIIFELK